MPAAALKLESGARDEVPRCRGPPSSAARRLEMREPLPSRGTATLRHAAWRHGMLCPPRGRTFITTIRGNPGMRHDLRVVRSSAFRRRRAPPHRGPLCAVDPARVRSSRCALGSSGVASPACRQVADPTLSPALTDRACARHGRHDRASSRRDRGLDLPTFAGHQRHRDPSRSSAFSRLSRRPRSHAGHSSARPRRRRLETDLLFGKSSIASVARNSVKPRTNRAPRARTRGDARAHRSRRCTAASMSRQHFRPARGPGGRSECPRVNSPVSARRRAQLHAPQVERSTRAHRGPELPTSSPLTNASRDNGARALVEHGTAAVAERRELCLARRGPCPSTPSSPPQRRVPIRADADPPRRGRFAIAATMSLRPSRSLTSSWS